MTPSVKSPLSKRESIRHLVYISIIFGLFILFSIDSYAQGDLLIFPKRIVFDIKTQNSEELNITNIGRDSSTYNISFLEYEMTEDGNMIQLDKNVVKYWYATPYLRVFPRKITLAPGESQIIKLQVRRKSDMASGEYRSHLYFRAEKNSSSLGSDTKKNNDGKLSIQLIPVYGITIPTIFRVGQTNATASFSDVQLETINDSISNLKVTINRFGNKSIYGDLIAEYVTSKGNPVEIATSRGIGIYTCINKRYSNLLLKNIRKYNLNNGKIRIRYISPSDTPFTIYAETDLR